MRQTAQKPLVLPDFRRKKIMTGLIWFCKDYRPFTIVENQLDRECTNLHEYLEHFFSIAGEAADDHRLSINPVNLEEQLFL